MDRFVGVGKTRKRSRSADRNNGSSYHSPPARPARPMPLYSLSMHVIPTNLDRGLHLPGVSRVETPPSSRGSLRNDKTVNFLTIKEFDGSPMPYPALTRKPVKLLLSDGDAHLLDFPDAPPVTSGGFCELYVAVHWPSKLKLAMKRPRIDFPTDDMLRRFRREAEIWSSLEHPYILPFLGTIEVRHRVYIVSPWMPLGDLLVMVQTRIKLIRQGRWLSDNSIPLVYRSFSEAKVIHQIATGLAYLHSISVVHGDIKAKNVLLSNEGSAQICDFGLTKTLNHSVTSTELHGVGSVRWQSPEILQGDPKSSKSDVYAFGMTISEILTGNYPFSHLKEQVAVIFAIMFRNERPPLQPSPLQGVDFQPLWNVATRCWQTNAEDRPHIQEVAQLLSPFALHSASTSIKNHYPITPFFDIHSAPEAYNKTPPWGLQDPSFRTLHPHLTRTPALFTPVYRLTPDALRSIFLFGYKSQPVEEKTYFAVTLSHICRHWRAVAIRSSPLWSLIQFTKRFPFEQQQLHLDRSNEAALDIQICGKFDSGHTGQLIKLLRPHVARWRSLDIFPDFKARSYRLLFDELRSESAPMLETLDVLNFSGQDHGWEFRPFGGGTPRLTRLSVSSCRLKGNLALFGHLVELCIVHDDPSATACRLTANDLLTILTQCASTIRTLFFNLPQCRSLQSAESMPLPLTFPYLQHITLYQPIPHEPPPHWVMEVYSSITAPNLLNHCFETIILRYFVFRGRFPFPGLLSLSMAHNDHLDTDDIPEFIFRCILTDLPHLRELAVDCIPPFDIYILISLCNDLQKLTLRGGFGGDSEVRNVIEARKIRAESGGTNDNVEALTLEGILLPDEEILWLHSHLREFHYLPNSRV